MPAKGQKGAGKQVKKSKKGAKKKAIDPFLKKEWFVVKVPKFLSMDYDTEKKHIGYRVGYSPARKGGARKQLENRTFIVNLADLQDKPFTTPHDDHAWKKYKFIVEDTFKKDQILTQWHGMEITRDKRCSLIRKWHTMIQAIADAKTTDGYVLRVKALGFTRRQLTQVRKNCYAKHSQVRTIRTKMCDIIKQHISATDLEGVIKRLAEGTIGKDIKKRCQLTFPLRDCLLEKVKVMRKPKRDVARLMQIHDLEMGFAPFDADAEEDEDEDEEGGSDDEAVSEISG